MVPSSESIPILVGHFGGDVVEWVVLLLLVVVGRWGFQSWVWVEIKSWVWVEIELCLCLWSGLGYVCVGRWDRAVVGGGLVFYG